MGERDKEREGPASCNVGCCEGGASHTPLEVGGGGRGQKEGHEDQLVELAARQQAKVSYCWPAIEDTGCILRVVELPQDSPSHWEPARGIHWVRGGGEYH